MSKSRSPTPTSNLCPPNSSPHSDSTSRHRTDEKPPAQSFGEREQIIITPRPTTPSLPHTSTSELSRPSASDASTSHSSRIRHLDDSHDNGPQQGRMAKRFRRQPSEGHERSDAHSSPSSDSQDGMADTEMDVGQAKQLEKSELLPITTAPKKKRTRTLTTPHQSAVLHALLAQSRFPTTAVREEVGRSIGLSARKVQIWFQNQRQKARRPRSGSDASRNRPPQYGPFPTAPEPIPAGSFAIEVDRKQEFHQIHRPAEDAPLDVPSRLLGPGMPGSDLYSGSPFSVRPIATPGTLLIHRETGALPLHPPPGIRSRTPPGEGVFGFRPPSSHGPGAHFHRDSSRTLPPLQFGRPPSQGGVTTSSTARPLSRHTGFSRAVFPIQAEYHHRPPSPEATFAHYPPESTAPPSSSLNLPPPFTLQPQPQWDNSAFTAVPRPSSSGWSRSRPGSRSTRDNTPSPISLRRDVPATTSTSVPPVTSDATHPISASHAVGSSHDPDTTTPRTGRYDPVRATFVSYPSPANQSTSTPSSPTHPPEDHSDPGE